MTEAPQALPSLQDDLIGWPVVDQLLIDIELGTRLFGVLVKTDARGMAEVDACDLGRAREALRSGAAVQLRYLLDGQEWWDTLIPCGSNVRIVRVEQT